MKFDTKLDERDFDTNITLIGKQEEEKDEERFSNLFKYFNTTEICLRGILYFDGVNTVFCEQIICLLKKEKNTQLERCEETKMYRMKNNLKF